MTSLALYLSIMALCYVIGAKLVKNPDKFTFVSKISQTAVYLLIFTMGANIGSNPEVISGLGSVGIQALATVIAALAGSIVAAYIMRKILGLDRHGLREGEDDVKDTSAENDGYSPYRASLLTFLDAVAGMAFGYLVILRTVRDTDAFLNVCGTLIDILLCLLLGAIGFGLGMEGKLIGMFRSIGVKILALPVASILGTFAFGFLYNLVSPLSLRETMAIFAGLGWYSFAPAAILKAGLTEAAAISFLHNIFREVFSIMLIPIVSAKIGYFEAAAMPGSSGMDCCLPSMRLCTNSIMVIYSLVSGVLMSLTIPVWMAIIL